MESKAIYRYPGSRPFEDTVIDRNLFFGREQEKEELLQKIIARKLVVLHAVSGLGKTSLLNAGVSQLLRERGFLPIKVRFNMAKISPVQAIYNSIKELEEEQNLDIEPGETETLWLYFKTSAFWSTNDSLLTPVLILDQFEEFFAIHKPEVRNEFIIQLADLVHNTIPQELRQAIRAGEPYHYGDEPPRVKIVISIRSDFIGQLDELSADIPEILDNRFRLQALTRFQAREAITGPAHIQDDQMFSRRFRYSDDAINSMLDYLSKRQERRGGGNKDEIESFELQLLCRHIETNILDKASEAGGQDEFLVKKEDLGEEAGMNNVLQFFYEDCLSGLKPAMNKHRVRRLCEKGLINDSDRRRILDEEDIETKYKVFPVLLGQLVDNRLLRAEKRVGSVYYELSHDTLIKPIRLSQQKRRATLEKYALMLLVPVIIVVMIFVISLNKSPKEKDEFAMGNEQYIQGDYDAAIASYQNALKLKPDYADAYNNMGNAQSNKGDYDAAIASYQKALELKPDYDIAYYNMGHAQFHKVDYDAAIASYQKALEIKPTYLAAKENISELYLITERFDQATEKANQVLNEKDVPQFQILSMKSIAISSLFFQSKQSEALKELNDLITYYRGLPNDYKPNWNYSFLKEYITQTKRLNEPTRALLLKMIELLEAPKKERDKILLELEKMAGEYK